MLSEIKALINKKRDFLETAEMLYEDITGIPDDDLIYYAEEDELPDDDTDTDDMESDDIEEPSEEPDDLMDTSIDDDAAEPEPAEPEVDTNDDLMNTPIDSVPGEGEPSVDMEPSTDDIDDLLSVSINLSSNTLSDVLPVPPMNAADAIADDTGDDLMSSQIDDGYDSDVEPEDVPADTGDTEIDDGAQGSDDILDEPIGEPDEEPMEEPTEDAATEEGEDILDTPVDDSDSVSSESVEEIYDILDEPITEAAVSTVKHFFSLLDPNTCSMESSDERCKFISHSRGHFDTKGKFTLDHDDAKGKSGEKYEHVWKCSKYNKVLETWSGSGTTMKIPKRCKECITAGKKSLNESVEEIYDILSEAISMGGNEEAPPAEEEQPATGDQTVTDQVMDKVAESEPDTPADDIFGDGNTGGGMANKDPKEVLANLTKLQDNLTKVRDDVVASISGS